MGPWWLYLIVFAFGYFTCKTFYFVREVRLGLIMLKVTHCIALYCLVKAYEQLEYAKNAKKNEMLSIGESEGNIKAYCLNFDELIHTFKRRSINDIINLHPSFYKDIIKFNDWDSAMSFLDTEGREYLNTFVKGKRYD